MLGRVLLLVLPSIALCFDAVLWSSGDAINRKSPPSMSTLIDLATVENPLVLFLLKEFQLSDFSRHANVYGAPSKASKGLKKWIAESKGYAAEWMDETTQLPAGLFVEYEGELPALSEKPIVVVHADSLDDIDDLADNVLQSLDRPYTAVLTGEEAVTTHAIKKRVAVKDTAQRGQVGEKDVVDSKLGEPIVFPRPGTPGFNATTCLLFIRKVGIQVYLPNYKTDRKLSSFWLNNATFDTAAQMSCLNVSQALTANTSTNSFTISLNNHGTGNGDFDLNNLVFTLSVIRSYTGYWTLNKIVIDTLELKYKAANKFLDGITVGSAIADGAVISSKLNGTAQPQAQAKRWAVSSVDTYSFACSVTPPAWIVGLQVGSTEIPLTNPRDANMIQVGIVLENFQLQPFMVRNGRFSRNVDDCVPTFSEGSWMGILVGLIFLFAFLFAMTMLNSVQTMDRFDDPKQKQIVINFKE